MSLKEQRLELTRELAKCEQGAFPGTKEWRRERKALYELGQFDEAHPEVLEALKEERAEEMSKKYPNAFDN